MSYSLTQKEYSNLKRRLTTVMNRMRKATTREEKIEAARRVVVECDHAERVFEAKGYPDAWSTWSRAREDAATTEWRAKVGLPL